MNKDLRDFSMWLGQRRQIQLAEQQAQLLEQQIKNKELSENELKHNLEHEKDLEQQKLEHEKEMRLLQMFDNVSIPLDIFQKFKNELFNCDDLMSEEDKKLQDEIMAQKFEKMNNKLAEVNKVMKNIENNNEDAIKQKSVKYTEEYKNFEDFVNGKIKLQKLSQNEIDELNFDEHTKELYDKEKAKTTGIIVFLSIILTLELIATSIAWIMYDNPSSITFITALTFMGLIAVIPNEEQLTEIKKSINKIINEKITINQSEELKIQQNIEDIEELKPITEKYNSILTEMIENKLNYLFEFRINHYNMQIEKLFYDSGFVKECEEKNLTFRSIDRSEIKNEGTFDDYFLFFNNFKQGYSKFAKKK